MKDLTKIENWTEDEKYIHKSRLIIGYILGFLTGLLLALYI